MGTDSLVLRPGVGGVVFSYWKLSKKLTLWSGCNKKKL